MAKFCVNCGTPLPDEAGFCPKCGAKVEIPHCPSCGKEVDFETEYCIYCGARLKEEPIPESEPVPDPIQSKEIPVATPEEDVGPKENNGSTFSWTYRRAYRRKHSFAARVENDYLLIAESERNAITTEIPLHSIQSIVLEAKASAFRWIMLAFIISLLPITMVIGRDILAIRSVSELLVAVLIIVTFTAALMWSNWFYLSHYCLTIMWQENEKKRYVFLKDKKADTLEQVQAVLTQATGIAPQSKKSNTVKIGVSIILGIALSVAAIFLLQPKQPAGEDITVKESGTPTPSLSVASPSPSPLVTPSEGPSNINESTSNGINIYDMVGSYSYDGSFEAGGLYQDFYYSLNIEQYDSGILIYAIWRGNYTIPETVVGPEALKDNVLTFYDGTEERTLTFVPASESIYGVNTIYLDGDEEIPYCMEGAFDDFIGAWRECIDEDPTMIYIEYMEGDVYFRFLFPTGEEHTGLLEMSDTGNITLTLGDLSFLIDSYDDQFIKLSRYDDEGGFFEYYFERAY